MKQVIQYIICWALFLLSVQTAAQCTPGDFVRPGIYPDSATGFPPAVATLDYNLVVTAVIPKDTIIFPLPRLPIDSIGIVAVQGLPAGFTVTPNRKSGYWRGGNKGCVLIAGKPTLQQIGKYPLVFNLVGYMGGLGLPMPADVTFYSITIISPNVVALGRIEHDIPAQVNIFPNPALESVNIYFSDSMARDHELQVYSMNGQLIARQKIFLPASDGVHTIQVKGFLPGIYLLRATDLSTGKSSSARFLKL